MSGHVVLYLAIAVGQLRRQRDIGRRYCFPSPLCLLEKNLLEEMNFKLATVFASLVMKNFLRMSSSWLGSSTAISRIEPDSIPMRLWRRLWPFLISILRRVKRQPQIISMHLGLSCTQNCRLEELGPKQNSREMRKPRRHQPHYRRTVDV